MINNANINTYFGAKWNIEICKSGSDGIESHFPLGTELKNNMILNNWLESLIYLFSPSGGAIRPYCDGLSFAAITKGAMHVGSGTGIPQYTQTGLLGPVKSTTYIRPFFNQCTGIYYPESGMAMFSRVYDFGIENKSITYSEAGFRPDIADAVATGKRNHLWSRFVFTKETGVSGYLYAISGNGITGMELSGVFANNNLYDIEKIDSVNYSGFSGIPSFELGWGYNWPENSGMFLIDESGNNTGFVYAPRNITNFVTGFISGYLSGSAFIPFNASNYPGGSGLSGIYIQDNTTESLYFPSGGNFTGFSGFIGKYFNDYSGFQYTGFSQGYSTYGSGFYPTQGSLTGSMTGIIGSRNVLKLDGYITGNIGYKNILNPVTLTTGEYLRIRYDTYMRIPAIVDPIPITGSGILYGEFNGSGQLKLIGQMRQIFGSIDGDGKVTQGNGIWWPIHTVNHKNLPAFDRDRTPYPNSHLSALMVASGSGVGFNTGFPPINSGVPIISLWLDDEIRAESDLDPLIGTCTGAYGIFDPNTPRNYYEKVWFSSAGLSNNTSWPMYTQNNLYVLNYMALNTPSAVWPDNINIQMIFAGQYPNRDSGFNGFLICKASEGAITESRSYTDNLGRTFGPLQFIKPTLYENTGAYLDCGLQRNYSAWYYKFDNTQIKYEDQIINLYLNFSVNRL